MSEQAVLRVCWFTNVPLPSACNLLGRPTPVFGGWLCSLADALIVTGQVKLQVITSVIGQGGTVTDADGVKHVLLGMSEDEYSREVLSYPGHALRQKYCDAVAEFRPDIIHVNGTEFSYGLLVTNKDIELPAVVSLQGMLGPYTRFDAGGIPFAARLRNSFVYDLVHSHSLVRGTTTTSRRVADVENRILRSNAMFIGRTLYDRACLFAVNRHAKYSHCDELMRLPFYAVRRDAQSIVRHSIFAPGSNHPRKGFHCLLAALALVKREFSDVTVRVPGRKPRRSWRAGWYERLLRKMIDRLDLEGQMVFLDSLSAEAMAAELSRAHVFAFPSFADNSPNSLAEAMLVGVPIVASYVGGIPSMVCDQETALCFPVGDEIVMAECIQTLFRDPELAHRLAGNAQQLARVRHEPSRVAQAMLEIYQQALGGNS
jgi:glycosyltransferase involved in cell wall biosynthesis